MSRLPFILCTLALAAGFFTLASTADAQIRYPGQTPATDPWLIAMVAEADRQWTAWGHPGELPAVDLADDLDGPDGSYVIGRGWAPIRNGECRIALLRSYTTTLLDQARRPYRTLRTGLALRLQRTALRDLMTTVMHEVGHSREMEHSAGGVMTNTPGSFDDSIVRVLASRTQAIATRR